MSLSKAGPLKSDDFWSKVSMDSQENFDHKFNFASDNALKPTTVHVTTKLSCLKGSMYTIAKEYEKILSYDKGYIGLSYPKPVYDPYSDKKYEETFTQVVPLRAFIKIFDEKNPASKLISYANSLIETWKKVNPKFPTATTKNPIDLRFEICKQSFFTVQDNQEKPDETRKRKYSSLDDNHSTSMNLYLSLYNFTHGTNPEDPHRDKKFPTIDDVKLFIKIKSSKFKVGTIPDSSPPDCKERFDSRAYNVPFMHFIDLIKCKEFLSVIDDVQKWDDQADERMKKQQLFQKKLDDTHHPSKARKIKKARKVDEIGVNHNLNEQEDPPIVDSE